MKLKSIRMVLAAAAVFGALAASAYEYNVRMPSSLARPRWTGAKPGEWTMDYEAAAAKAKTVVSADCHAPQLLYDDDVKKAYQIAQNWGLNLIDEMPVKKH